MHQTTIRRASRLDVPQLLDIYNEVVLTSTAIYDEKPRTLDEQFAWFDLKSASEYPLFVTEMGNTVVGYCTYGAFRDWPCYKYSIEHSLHVHSSYRGQGIGQKMLRFLIEDAKISNYHTIIGGIDSDNRASIKLHEKYGFKQIAVVCEVGYKFGRWLDLCLFQKILSK
jgi:phosphinothricin acetyltransferase